MCNMVLLLFGKLPQWNLHVNCHVNGTKFQSDLRFQTGLSLLRVSCKSAHTHYANRYFFHSGNQILKLWSQKQIYFKNVLILRSFEFDINTCDSVFS